MRRALIALVSDSLMRWAWRLRDGYNPHGASWKTRGGASLPKRISFDEHETERVTAALSLVFPSRLESRVDPANLLNPWGARLGKERELPELQVLHGGASNPPRTHAISEHASVLYF